MKNLLMQHHKVKIALSIKKPRYGFEFDLKRNSSGRTRIYEYSTPNIIECSSYGPGWY